MSFVSITRTVILGNSFVHNFTTRRCINLREWSGDGFINNANLRSIPRHSVKQVNQAAELDE
jgi:hypothetical protein